MSSKISEEQKLKRRVVHERLEADEFREGCEIVKNILKFIGENSERDGLKGTPARVVKSWQELFSGYSFKEEHIKELLTEFDSDYDELILLKNIEFYSTCEHHLLPFLGTAHIGYLPKKKVVGISKLARLLEIYSRRLQIQERLTTQITQAIMKHLNPFGAGCVINAKHLCMVCRGVQKQNSVMTTSSLEGVFKSDPSVRNEFLRLIEI